VRVSLEDTPLSGGGDWAGGGEEGDDDTIDRQCWDESSFPVRGGGGGGGGDDGSSEVSQISYSHQEAAKNFTVVGADDFLPLFVYVLVSSSSPPPSHPPPLPSSCAGPGEPPSARVGEGDHVEPPGPRGALRGVR
jgi:hypothetical protein